LGTGHRTLLHLPQQLTPGLLAPPAPRAAAARCNVGGSWTSRRDSATRRRCRHEGRADTRGAADALPPSLQRAAAPASRPGAAPGSQLRAVPPPRGARRALTRRLRRAAAAAAGALKPQRACSRSNGTSKHSAAHPQRARGLLLRCAHTLVLLPGGVPQYRLGIS
jgi:hypothetical protein